ncbi:uncharacterized protein STEHIDRAFT_148568 [Stereum hirsutum FP-91666 SS1]|uniref:uncharacterized protein n=1 Tax=Stereum hirsutum (strain FP-91666) TaxID=721885 RepID=UPI000444A889|nr:uncharacterized protein STEHIDRAFT_148568 [Stereum hirsutum FP-91666 SS1]EIM83724.1 hypothetical protein STEHIDRAFT_148568 [Stereum hirsutum FP-91666 SS1]
MKGFSPLFKAHEADSSDPEGENDDEEEESYESGNDYENEQSRMAADGESPEDGTLDNPDGSSERRSDSSPPHMTHRSITKPGAIPIPHSNLTRFYDAQAQSQSGVTSQSPSQSLSHSHSPGSNPSSHSTSQSHSNSHRDYPIPSLTHSNSSSSTISSTILTPDCTGSGPVPGVGATGAAPSSLPHPNPASYFLKRHEKQRERDYSTLPRHYSTSSTGPPPSILSSSITNASTTLPRQSKLKPAPAPTPSPSSSPEPRFAEVVDSGDEGGRITHRRQVLDDLLTDPVRPINLPVSPASIPAATITTGEFPYEKDVQVHVVNPARETRRESGRTSSRVQGQTDRDHTRDREREREKEQRHYRPQPTPSPVPAPVVADPVPTPSVQGQPRVSHASEAAQALERERERRRRETQSQNGNGAPATAPLVTPLRESPASRASNQQEAGSYFPQPGNMTSRNGTSRGANFNESQAPASGYNQQPGEMSREYSHESRNTYEGEYQEPSRSKRSQREQLERKSSGRERERERERDGREHRRREERDREKARDRDRDRDYDRERDRERALTGGGLTRRTAAAVGEA